MLPMGETLEGAKCEELEKIVIDDDSEKFFQVRAQLPLREKEELIMFLKRNIDVFAWSAYEALGGGSKFHLPSFECQSFRHPQKATTSALI